MRTNKMKVRKLYGVRYFVPNEVFSKVVGHKCRLIPRLDALKIVRRLQKSGVDAVAYPLAIHVTPEQEAYLNKRYG